MLDHGLEIVGYALKLRQSHLLPLGAASETQAAQADAWSAAIAYAALLHDIGKIAVDVEVRLDEEKRWHPWHGPIVGTYRISYPEGRDYQLHGAAAGLMYMQVLPAYVLDWLSRIPEIWGALLFLLAGQYERAGILGELVIQADRASVAQELGANPERAASAPVGTLQRQITDGVKFLVKEQFKLNQPEASDGWLTNDALWLVSKTFADKLRAHLLAQGVEGIPSSNPTMFNVLQDHGIIQNNPEGKAVWKACVTNGEWQMQLTFLKIAPALIWSVDERPTTFTGSVVAQIAPAAGNQDSGAVEILETPVAPLKTSSAPPLPFSPAEEPVAENEIDFLLEMLGSSAELPTAQVVNCAESRRKCPELNAAASFVGNLADSVLQSSDWSFEPLRLGSDFMAWLAKGVSSHKIIINDAKAKVHTVDGTAFLVTPELFRRFAQEHVDLARQAKEQGMVDWKMVQRAFEKLALHRKREDGLNIWTCEITGPRKTRLLKGYLLKDPSSIFATVPYDNPYLKLMKMTGAEEDA
jgi:hypothetical protein